MTCEQAMVLMSARLDGAIDREQSDALQAHLDGCPACRQLAETLNGLDRRVANLGEPAPEGLKKGVLYRIDQATGKAKKPTRRWFGPGTALGAAAAVLVLLVGLKVFPLGQTLYGSASTDKAATSAPQSISAAMEELAHQNEGSDQYFTLKPNLTQSGTVETGSCALRPTEAEESDYYRNGGKTAGVRLPARPVTEGDRTLCAALSSRENAMVLLYTEFSPESLFDLLRVEEPSLYALTEELEAETVDSAICYATDCGTALAIQEWLLSNLPQSEGMEADVREAETGLMIRMESLDPGSESLYRVITWAPRAHPIAWPQTWPEDWAIHLRTEENWGLFFPAEDYTPNEGKTAYLVFAANSDFP